MIDNEFDNFVNGKLKDHEAPVPAGLWDKLKDKQFDDFVGDSLKDQTAAVPDGLWDKITDAQFDQFLGNTISEYTAPVPDGLWAKLADANFDASVQDKIGNYIAPVPESLWGKVADAQFDAFVGSSLKDYIAPVPEGLWEKIHPEEKEERRIFYFLRIPAAAIFIFAILMGGTAAYIWLKPHFDSSRIPAVTGLSKNHNKQAIDSPANTIAHDNQPEPVSNANTNSNHTNSTVPGKDISTTPVPNAPNSIEKKKDILTSKDQVSHAPLPFNQENLPVVNNNHLPASKKNRLDGSIANRNNLLNGSGNPLSSGDLAIQQQPVPPITKIDSTDGGNNPYIYIPPYQSNFSAISTIPFTAFTGLRDFSGKELTDYKHASQIKSNIICPSNRNNPNTDWFAEVYASPDFAVKSFSNVSASQQYLLKKDSIESMRVGFTAGIRLVKPINENFLIKTGIQYSQINQQYLYRTENEIKTTTVVTVRTIVRAPGDTVVIADTSVLQQIGYKNNIAKNRFRSVDVPVIIGYQFGNEDIKFGINAGVIFNLSSWYQGVILDTSLAIVPLTKSNNMVYKTNIGMGLYAGFSITKQLSEDLHIFFEPYFRYNLSNMTSNQSPYNQKFSVGGLSIGLRFNLNKQ